MSDEVIDLRVKKISGLLRIRFLALKKHYGHKTNTGAFTEIVNRLYESVIGENELD